MTAKWLLNIVMLEMVEGNWPCRRQARKWSDDVTDWCGYTLPADIGQDVVEKNHRNNIPCGPRILIVTMNYHIHNFTITHVPVQQLAMIRCWGPITIKDTIQVKMVTSLIDYVCHRMMPGGWDWFVARLWQIFCQAEVCHVLKCRFLFFWRHWCRLQHENAFSIQNTDAESHVITDW